VVGDDLLSPCQFLPEDLPQFSWFEDTEVDGPLLPWTAKLTSTPRRQATTRPALASHVLQDSLELYDVQRCADLCDVSGASSARLSSSQLTYSEDEEYSGEYSPCLEDVLDVSHPLSPLAASEQSGLSEDSLDSSHSSLNSTDLEPYMCSDASSLSASRTYYDSICAGFDVSMDTSGSQGGGPICQDLSVQGQASSGAEIPLIISPIYELCTEL
jgi:hypothetical protein